MPNLVSLSLRITSIATMASAIVAVLVVERWDIGAYFVALSVYCQVLLNKEIDD